MTGRSPRSWQQQFLDSLRREHPSSVVLKPSIDEYIAEFPLEPDRVYGAEMDDLHRAALRASVLRHVAFISNDLELAREHCQSPPERAMLYALAIVAWDWVDGVLIRLPFDPAGVPGGALGFLATHGTYVEIAPQACVSGYRVDFLISMRYRVAPERVKSAQLVVECDGHEFHERTREQARRDRERDRALQASDLAVFRYTGSDLWRDVFAAATEAVDELARRFEMVK